MQLGSRRLIIPDQVLDCVQLQCCLYCAQPEHDKTILSSGITCAVPLVLADFGYLSYLSIYLWTINR